MFELSCLNIPARKRRELTAILANRYSKIAVHDGSCIKRSYVARGLHYGLQMVQFEGKLCRVCPAYDSDPILFNISPVHRKSITESPRYRIVLECLRRDVCHKKEIIAIRCDSSNHWSKVREANETVGVLNLETIKSFRRAKISSPFAPHISAPRVG